MSKCDTCEYASECEDAYMINFCDECKWHDECPLMTHYCKADHSIECNNGFEPIPEFDDEEDLDEDTIAKLSGYIPYEDGGY